MQQVNETLIFLMAFGVSSRGSHFSSKPIDEGKLFSNQIKSMSRQTSECYDRLHKHREFIQRYTGLVGFKKSSSPDMSRVKSRSVISPVQKSLDSSISLSSVSLPIPVLKEKGNYLTKAKPTPMLRDTKKPSVSPPLPTSYLKESVQPASPSPHRSSAHFLKEFNQSPVSPLFRPISISPLPRILPFSSESHSTSTSFQSNIQSNIFSDRLSLDVYDDPDVVISRIKRKLGITDISSALPAPPTPPASYPISYPIPFSVPTVSSTPPPALPPPSPDLRINEHAILPYSNPGKTIDIHYHENMQLQPAPLRPPPYETLYTIEDPKRTDNNKETIGLNVNKMNISPNIIQQSLDFQISSCTSSPKSVANELTFIRNSISPPSSPITSARLKPIASNLKHDTVLAHHSSLYEVNATTPNIINTQTAKSNPLEDLHNESKTINTNNLRQTSWILTPDEEAEVSKRASDSFKKRLQEDRRRREMRLAASNNR